MPKPTWVLDARAARASIGERDSVAQHPAVWSDDYRAFVRRALSSRLFATIGACDLFDETLTEWLVAEETGTKARLWATDLASQRLTDGVTGA